MGEVAEQELERAEAAERAERERKELEREPVSEGRPDEQPAAAPAAPAPKALSVFEQFQVNTELRATAELANVFVQSGFFQNVAKMSQGIVKILAGKELGIEPFAAMSELHIIEGKITMSANLIAALVKRSQQYGYRVQEHTAEKCTLAFYEREFVSGQMKEIGVSSFTIEDARTAQLLGKNNWKHYPRAMLFARAMSQGARWFCPDVFGGSSVYAEGEIEQRGGETEEAFREAVDVVQTAVGAVDVATGEVVAPDDPNEPDPVAAAQAAEVEDAEVVPEPAEPLATPEQQAAIIKACHEADTQLPDLLGEHEIDRPLKEVTEKEAVGLLIHLNKRITKRRKEQKAAAAKQEA